MKAKYFKNIIVLFIFILLMESCNSEIDYKSLVKRKEKVIEQTKKYLENNMSYIGECNSEKLYNQNIKFPIPQEVLDNKEFFFIGEEHCIQMNIVIEYKIIEYLVKNAGVRNIFLETPYSYAILYNKYLETNDTKYLEELLTLTDNTLFKEYYDFYFNLNKLSDSLPNGEKLVIYGIDSGFYLKSLLYISQFIPKDKKPNKYIEIEINKLKDYCNEYSKSYKIENNRLNKHFKFKTVKLIKEIYKSINLYEKYYEEYFDRDYGSFKEFIILTYNGNRAGLRDEIMYKNFSFLYPKLKGKSVGIFGRFHATLKTTEIYKNQNKLQVEGNVDKVKNIAEILNQNSILTSNKVLSIGLFYNNCISFYNRANTRAIDLKNPHLTQTQEKALKYFTMMTDKDITFFDLMNRKSPFMKYNYNASNTFEFFDKSEAVFTDYYNYIILIQNSGNLNIEKID